MWLRLAAVVLVGQFEDSLDTSHKVVPFPLSPTRRAQIRVAVEASRRWAAHVAREMVPAAMPGDAPVDRIRADLARRGELDYLLTEAARAQIREAYGVDEKAVYEIMHDPYISRARFAKEALPTGPPAGTFRLWADPYASTGTRFDPAKIRLRPADARRFHYRQEGDEGEHGAGGRTAPTGARGAPRAWGARSARRRTPGPAPPSTSPWP